MLGASTFHLHTLFFIFSQVKHVLGTEEVLHIFPEFVRQRCGSMFNRCKERLKKITCTRGEEANTTTSQVCERLQRVFLRVIHYLWGTGDSDLTIEEKVNFNNAPTG